MCPWVENIINIPKIHRVNTQGEYRAEAVWKFSENSSKMVHVKVPNSNQPEDNLHEPEDNLGMDKPTKTDKIQNIANFCHYKRYFGHKFWKKFSYIFRKRGRGKGCLEFFQKIIYFGGFIRP